MDTAAVAAGNSQHAAPGLDLEPRWPLVLTILVVVGLTMLPGRVRVLPEWATFIIAAVLLFPMAGLRLSSAKPRWLQIESWVTAAFVFYGIIAMLVDLKDLFVRMVTPPNGITGIQLLNSSIALWASNILIFAVAYWRIDRGGSIARAEGVPAPPDFVFPREGTDDERLAAWRPTFPDYLYLAFCTAAAFTPAEAMPMSTRAKMLMMTEGLIALVTILAVASRAIGLLGS